MGVVKLRMSFSIVVEQSRNVSGIFRVFVVSEEKQVLLKLFNNKLLLSFCVVHGLRVYSFGGFFELVCLRCRVSFRYHFFNSSLCVCAVQVSQIS